MKSILVPFSGSDTDRPLFETALAAARPFSGHLQFLHVRVGAGEAAVNDSRTGFAMGAALTNVLKKLGDEATTRSAAAVQHFRELCAQSKIEVCDLPVNSQGVTASWNEVDGQAMKRIMSRARHSDLVVVGRARKQNLLPSDFLEQLVVGCGRPILIAPSAPRQTLTGTIMICWRDTAEAARAVGTAMPLLANAKRVVVASVAEKGEESSESLAHVERHLAWNGISAEIRVIKAEGGSPPELLAAAAEGCDADLVVLGAYGHSQLREMLFGGCTQSFLRQSDRPVLMMH
jgi:nucleotide-binding universal stress UspA family protein